MVQMIFSAPGEQPLPAVAWNYEEVKAEVEASLAQYKDRAPMRYHLASTVAFKWNCILIRCSVIML